MKSDNNQQFFEKRSDRRSFLMSLLKWSGLLLLSLLPLDLFSGKKEKGTKEAYFYRKV